MGNPSTTERDSARMGYEKVLAIDSYCGCCADWHEVKSSLDWSTWGLKTFRRYTVAVSKGPPRRGSLYRHYKGGLYAVLGYSGGTRNPEVGGPGCRPRRIKPQPMVVYLSVSTGATWVRDLSEWHEEVEVGGTTLPRFQHFSGGDR
mgnify:CR=1 FL=1